MKSRRSPRTRSTSRSRRSTSRTRRSKSKSPVGMCGRCDLCGRAGRIIAETSTGNSALCRCPNKHTWRI